MVLDSLLQELVFVGLPITSVPPLIDFQPSFAAVFVGPIREGLCDDVPVNVFPCLPVYITLSADGSSSRREIRGKRTLE